MRDLFAPQVWFLRVTYQQAIEKLVLCELKINIERIVPLHYRFVSP